MILASPISACSVGMFLLMSVGSTVLWMNVLFAVGKRMPNPVAVKLAPMPNTTSASCTCRCTDAGIATPPEPSDSGWSSGKLLLPSSDVVTGISSSSASCFSSGQASL